MDKIILNRLDITGPIDSNTPKIVIEEICLAHNIICDSNLMSDSNYLNKVINMIYDSPKEFIPISYKDDRQALKTICAYVNYNHKGWKRGPLLTAFDFLQSFINVKNISINDYNIGSQTNDCPESLNACILYSLCKNSKIKLYFNTTIDQMALLLRLYQNANSPDLLYNIKNNIYNLIKFNECDILELINLIYSIKPNSLEQIENNNYIAELEEYKPDVNTWHDLEHLCNIYRSDENINIPSNHIEAIVYTAIHYKMDISNTLNPFREYLEIQKNPYFPYDTEFCNRIKEVELHPDSFLNPYLNDFFNPNLPPNMYSLNNLYKLCESEGISYQYDMFGDSLYALLQSSCLMHNFYHGKQGNIINAENTFFEEIDDLEYDEVLIYGIRVDDSYIAFSYGELAEIFSKYKRFLNPETNMDFGEEAINKLEVLIYKPIRNTESIDAYSERLKLREEFERVKMFIQTKNNDILYFLNLYDDLDIIQQEKIQYILILILNSAMYMRGWDGDSDYPLDSRATTFPQEEQINVDHRVTQSLIGIDRELEKNENSKLVMKLPLMQYYSDSKSFIASADETDGLTIEDRINIVKGGEDGNITSCIRMSSNKLCASAYYYMRLIGMKMPFDIEDVSYIT